LRKTSNRARPRGKSQEEGNVEKGGHGAKEKGSHCFTLPANSDSKGGEFKCSGRLTHPWGGGCRKLCSSVTERRMLEQKKNQREI